MMNRRHFVCSKCHRVNRVRAEYLGRTLRCGGCSETLRAETQVLELDFSTLERLISVAPVPILIDFWASWCAPCRAFAPQFDEFATMQHGRAIVGKINVDDHPRAARKYKVQSVPTLGVWNTGTLHYLQPGILTPTQMDALIAPHRQYVV